MSTHRGITWQDFPGNCDGIDKRMNFALFKRGSHPFNSASKGLEGEALKAKLQELSQRKRQQFGALRKKRRVATCSTN